MADQCPRRHEVDPLAVRRGRRRRNRDDDETPVEEQVCRNYAQGRCRFGSDCPRIHVGDIDQVRPEKIDEVCNNFKAGRCRFGAFCRRKHEE